MGYSINRYTYSGSNEFDIAFTLGYIKKSDVFAYVTGEVDTEGNQVFRDINWVDDNRVRVLGDLKTGDEIVLQRVVSKQALAVDFESEGTATRTALNTGFKQAIMAVHELFDGVLADTALVAATPEEVETALKFISDYTTELLTVGATDPDDLAQVAATLAGISATDLNDLLNQMLAINVAVAEAKVQVDEARDLILATGSENLVTQYAQPEPDKQCAIIKQGDDYLLYSPLAVPGYWALDELTRTTSAMRRPYERSISYFADVYQEQFDNFITSGTFTRYNNSQSLGGSFRGVFTTGAYLEYTVTVDGTSNVLQLIHANRDTANYISITINGSTDLVNLLPEVSGERVVDPYINSNTILVNHYTAFAIVPAGTYTIRATMSTNSNPAGIAPNAMYVQGLAVLGGTSGLPGSERSHAPIWISGETVAVSDQRWFQGVTYRATTAGTTAGTDPLSDTNVTWVSVADTYSKYTEKYFTAVSEPMWAVWLSLGQAEEDFGGAIHGNVTLTSTTVYANDFEINLTDYVPLYAERIDVIQEADLYHTVDPGTVVATATMSYSVLSGGNFPYRNSIIPAVSGQLGLYYPGMLPLYHYSAGAGFRYQIRRCAIQGQVPANPADYYGLSNPTFGNNHSLQLLGLVAIDSPVGSAGVPNVDQSSKYTAAVSLELTRDSVLGFNLPGAETYWDMNTSGADPSAGGYTGMVCKGYFKASNGSTKLDISAGTPIISEGIYRVSLYRGSAPLL